jgi:uncharacterized membrane protein
MEGEVFSIIGICALLVGVVISLVSNFKYNNDHNFSSTGYREVEQTQKHLETASVITLSAGYVLSIIGFAMNNDSIFYTAKSRHHVLSH